MALGTGWFKRGGSNGGITDADGRTLTHVTGGMVDTLGAGASVSAPAINVSVGNIVAPPAGVYNVRVVVALTGTAETALANLQLRSNGVNRGTLATLSGAVTAYEFQRVTHTTGNLSVAALAGATAGSVYTVSMQATQVE